jgi:hypothetical protein
MYTGLINYFFLVLFGFTLKVLFSRFYIIKILKNTAHFSNFLYKLGKYLIAICIDFPIYFRETLPLVQFSSFEAQKTENWIDNPDP